MFQHYESFRHGFIGIQIDPRLEETGEKCSTNANALRYLLTDVLQYRLDLQGKMFSAREWEAHFVAVTGKHDSEEKKLLAPKYMSWIITKYEERFRRSLDMNLDIDKHTGIKKYSFHLSDAGQRHSVRIQPVSPGNPNDCALAVA